MRMRTYSSVVGRGVDANLDPSEQTILNALAEVDELRDGVEVLVGLQDRPHVLVVGGQILRVLGVRVGGLDFCAQVVWVEKLPDVCHRSPPHRDGAV